MKSKAEAEILATFLVKTSQAMGKKSSALITNMNTPLGNKIGNFLEIEETIECLQGKGPADVMEVTYALGVEMLMMANLAKTEEEALAKCKEAVSSGAALKKFLENVEVQGGNADQLMSQIGKRRSEYKINLTASQDGYISINAYKTGMAGVSLGVGRNKTTDPVCGDAGMILHAHTGDMVRKGDLIMEIFGKDKDCLEPAKRLLEEAVTYSEKQPEKNPLIFKKI